MSDNRKGDIIRYTIHGFQWAAIVIAFVLIFGLIIGELQCFDSQIQVEYIQKLLFFSGLTLLLQASIGHKMPLFAGPAAVLLIGMLASQGHDPAAPYSAMFYGGIILVILSLTGILEYIRHLFTSRIIAAILLMISFSLIPTILSLLTSPRNGGGYVGNVIFAFVFLLLIFAMYRILPGLLHSALVIWSLVLGVAGYGLLFSLTPLEGSHEILSLFSLSPVLPEHIDPGIMFAFTFCYIALLMNDIGAIQSLEPLFLVSKMKERVKRGVCVTGIINTLSGLFGVIGGVNYSLSAGMVLATGSVSRYPLFAASAIVVAISLSPFCIAYLLLVPPVIIGCMLLYVMTSQFAAALLVAIEGDPAHPFRFEDGLVIGLPILFGTMMAFLPDETIDAMPYLLQPVLANGFVAGVLCAFIMEHILFRRRDIDET
ncbi:MAG: purine/pyrimidine permease [Methanospirillaceae archaeon]|nr:purine/pyrimidine permease [Methanospirillaceae archaeon]